MASKFGANLCFQKPVNLAELIASIEDLTDAAGHCPVQEKVGS
jgi:hypothetical protein